MGFLKNRADFWVKQGYPKQKWIIFCETMLSLGFDVFLTEAQQTRSKYVQIERNQRVFRVRFSDHKPIQSREINKDCDFFVGITNLATTTTNQAIMAVKLYFGIPIDGPAFAPAEFKRFTDDAAYTRWNSAEIPVCSGVPAEIPLEELEAQWAQAGVI